MEEFTKLSCCHKLIFGIGLLHANVFIMYTKYQIVSAKAVLQVDFPAYTLSMLKHNPLRITKGTNSNRIGTYLSVVHVHQIP